jgi:hypothetical protein
MLSKRLLLGGEAAAVSLLGDRDLTRIAIRILRRIRILRVVNLRDDETHCRRRAGGRQKKRAARIAAFFGGV